MYIASNAAYALKFYTHIVGHTYASICECDSMGPQSLKLSTGRAQICSNNMNGLWQRIKHVYRDSKKGKLNYVGKMKHTQN
jgi:hypothetical protein